MVAVWDGSDGSLTGLHLMPARKDHDSPAAEQHGFKERLTEAVAETITDKAKENLAVQWQISPSSGYPLAELPQISGLLDNTTDWLRSQVQNPAMGMASIAGASGPASALIGGTAANLATAPLVKPLSQISQAANIVGFAVGAITGIHPLTVACAQRLAKNLVNKVVVRGVETLFRPTAASPERTHTARPPAAAAISSPPRLASPPLHLTSDLPADGVTALLRATAVEDMPNRPAAGPGIGSINAC